ncbi:hypothetical protein C8Q79DRAFT_439320 [Trametes meyenii]|nr:hypothetical protein C8Q79DRAFT_439320 [Trametes meyenii]
MDRDPQRALPAAVRGCGRGAKVPEPWGSFCLRPASCESRAARRTFEAPRRGGMLAPPFEFANAAAITPAASQYTHTCSQPPTVGNHTSRSCSFAARCLYHRPALRVGVVRRLARGTAPRSASQSAQAFRSLVIAKHGPVVRFAVSCQQRRAFRGWPATLTPRTIDGRVSELQAASAAYGMRGTETDREVVHVHYIQKVQVLLLLDACV